MPSPASGRGLPLPVTANPRTPNGLGIYNNNSDARGSGRAKRNVSGPLRRRARKSRSPTPFPGDEDENETWGDDDFAKENQGPVSDDKNDPFGSIEAGLASDTKSTTYSSRQDPQLHSLYDRALRRERFQKGYGMYVETEDEDGKSLLSDHHHHASTDHHQTATVPSYSYDGAYGSFKESKSPDVASFHTDDSDLAPHDYAGYSEGDGFDLADYKDHHDESLLPPSETAHFGPAPQGRVTRRHQQHRAKKVVNLTQGNLVIDLKIPTRLEGFLPKATRGRMGEESDEVLYTRYSAVTASPDDFAANHFTLRQKQYQRDTELMIVITMYNENETLFLRTLYGVMRNISHMEGRKNSGTWGPGSWKKVGSVYVHVRVNMADSNASTGRRLYCGGRS